MAREVINDRFCWFEGTDGSQITDFCYVCHLFTRQCLHEFDHKEENMARNDYILAPRTAWLKTGRVYYFSGYFSD